MEDLFSRLFAILNNLDSPEVSSDLSATGQRKLDQDCQSFLLHDTCMFRSCSTLFDLQGRRAHVEADQARLKLC